MTQRTRSPSAPLHPEDAAAVLTAVALDIDAVAVRTVKALRRLETGQADRKLVEATRRAMHALPEVAAALRREGLLGP